VPDFILAGLAPATLGRALFFGPLDRQEALAPLDLVEGEEYLRDQRARLGRERRAGLGPFFQAPAVDFRVVI
jgi:hypothetical protein